MGTSQVLFTSNLDPFSHDTGAIYTVPVTLNKPLCGVVRYHQPIVEHSLELASATHFS